MVIASTGHFFGQIPQPMHSTSEMKAILDVGVTSMHSLPMRTTGQLFRHSWWQSFGLHLSSLTMAIRVSLPDMGVNLAS
ncbi:hypothetical protein GQ42DRAFT_122152 [Ramicandelaber brevisporus]|nr:hypothetical protein GQ42DRAFT_122152 [Ramicandelaber brevisporus]